MGRCGYFNDMKRFPQCMRPEVLALADAYFGSFDQEAPDHCERILCGIPGCCTGSHGLGVRWQCL